jgi:glucose-6-phosphate isomerase
VRHIRHQTYGKNKVLIKQTILCPEELPKYEISGMDELKKLDCFSYVNVTKDLDVLANPRLQKWRRHNKFVIFGVGGSSLGGQCIQAISKSDNVKFIDNIDPATLRKIFLEINPAETGFLCISKSGETLETIHQVTLALDLVGKKKDKFVFITEDKQSPLREIAHELDVLCLDHPTTVGGRFSVFTIVGMLPAALCGVDPLKIRLGGKQVLENYLGEVEKGARFINESFRKRITQHVLFIYSDKLAPFGAWLAQLYAESTGKCGSGITQLTARGSTDQHSQLQLYLDGSRDKCFTFFFENQESEQQISSNKYLPKTFSYLEGKTTADIFKAQYTATITSLLEKKYNVREIKIQEISPEILGALFIHFMLEVACICKLMEVNPFDQPAVECGKILTRKFLSEDADKIR